MKYEVLDATEAEANRLLATHNAFGNDSGILRPAREAAIRAREEPLDENYITSHETTANMNLAIVSVLTIADIDKLMVHAGCTERQQACIWAYYHTRYTRQEVAQRMGLKKHQVDYDLATGIQRLRRYLINHPMYGLRDILIEAFGPALFLSDRLQPR